MEGVSSRLSGLLDWAPSGAASADGRQVKTDILQAGPLTVDFDSKNCDATYQFLSNNVIMQYSLDKSLTKCCTLKFLQIKIKLRYFL
jgi:hypothetical protein